MSIQVFLLSLCALEREFSQAEILVASHFMNNSVLNKSDLKSFNILIECSIINNMFYKTYFEKKQHVNGFVSSISNSFKISELNPLYSLFR